MFFCPKCDFSLDLSKNLTKTDKSGKKIVNNVTSIINLINNKDEENFEDTLSKYLFKIELDKLEKIKEFQKLDNQYQNIIKNNLIGNQVDSNISFVCKNCNYQKILNETIRLYQTDIKGRFKSKPNIPQVNELYLNDNTLPKTNNYSCRNINCIKYKNKDHNSYATFYRNYDNSIIYVCNECKYSWEN